MSPRRRIQCTAYSIGVGSICRYIPLSFFIKNTHPSILSHIQFSSLNTNVAACGPLFSDCCDCTGGTGFPPQKVPCNNTVGYENVFEQFGKWMKGTGCKRTIFQPNPTVMDCYRDNVFAKLSAENHGSWYSTLAQGYCGGAGASACTWRVVSVDKVVHRTCHVQVFGAEVAATAPSCFDNCGDQKANTSSPCWVNCFYKAALGPDAGTPGAPPSGLSIAALVAAWTKPFLPEAQGGCPAL